MRTLTELYQIAYEHVKDVPDGQYNGICHLISELEYRDIITIKEWIKLKDNLYENKPTEWKHINFIACKEFCGEDDVFWWPKGEWYHRKLFLQEMIMYTKPWYKKIGYLWQQLKSIESL